MINGPLSDRLEYAILQSVFLDSSGDRQNSWGGWETNVRALVPDYSAHHDLLNAFKRLREGGVLRLNKPDDQSRHAIDYSGNDIDDNAFFFTGVFNAIATPSGRSYWDGIRINKATASIGFPRP